MLDLSIASNRENQLNLIVSGMLIIFPAIVYYTGQIYYLNLASHIVLLALAGVGLNLALGYGGMISFGHAAFFGVGGYLAGILPFHASEGSALFSIGIDIPGSNSLPIILATTIVSTGLLALLIGFLSIRTKGANFIMITLAFAQMIYYLAISIPTYGGEDGLVISFRNEFFYFDSSNPAMFFGIALCFLFFSLLLTHRLTRSRFGAALQVARMNEQRLETLGISAFQVKLTAFVFSGMLTGVAGALYADLYSYVSPSMLAWQKSGEILIIVILGGIGRLYGPVIGATVFVLLENWLGEFTEYWQFFLGLVLLCLVLFKSGGIVGQIIGNVNRD